MFAENKLTQIAGYFLGLGGNEMNYMKLIKLLYLADREMLKRHGFAISNDSYYAMDNGMVLSATLDLIKGVAPGDVWSKSISAPKNYMVMLTGKTEDDLLSVAELKIMREIFDGFGDKNEWELSDYMHENLPEWKDPKHSSIPVSLREILDALTDDEVFKAAAIEEFERGQSLKRVVGD